LSKLNDPTIQTQGKTNDGIKKNPRMIIAHRGGVVDAERSENSLKALQEAILRGYTHVENDARTR